MRRTEYADLSEQYENPQSEACNIRVGQVFYTDGVVKPVGLCDSAWQTVLPFVSELARGGGNFYDGWMKNPKSAMLSCNDGFRPVTFLVEVVDPDVYIG